MHRLPAMTLLALTLFATACGSGGGTTTTLAAPSPTPATNTGPAPATDTATAAPALDAPERVGAYRRIDFEGGAELAQSLVGEGVEASIFAVYGESADEESAAFMLVAARSSTDPQLTADRLADAVVSSLTGKPVDAATLTEHERDGLRFRCGSAAAEGASFRSGFCVWIDGRVAAVGLGVPPRGPSDGNAVLPIVIEAARGLGD